MKNINIVHWWFVPAVFCVLISSSLFLFLLKKKKKKKKKKTIYIFEQLAYFTWNGRLLALLPKQYLSRCQWIRKKEKRNTYCALLRFVLMTPPMTQRGQQKKKKRLINAMPMTLFQGPTTPLKQKKDPTSTYMHTSNIHPPSDG